MIRSRGYSLWLMPTGDLYDKLFRLIANLSGKYATPLFQPHVTLLAEVVGPEEEIVSKTMQLAAAIRSYEITLTTVAHNIFMCPFLRVKATGPVMEANARARELFQRQGDLPYLPHLGLIYGDFTAETKEQIIAEIGREFNETFLVRSIHLVSTAGEPKDWHGVREFVLEG